MSDEDDQEVLWTMTILLIGLAISVLFGVLIAEITEPEPTIVRLCLDPADDPGLCDR